jgi:hypothetical protein
MLRVLLLFLTLTVSSWGSLLVYTVNLDGPSEAPPNASPGFGSATVTVDDVLLTMRLEVTFTDLLGTTTAAHIHCCTAVAGVATALVATMVPNFTGFPLGVSSGVYDDTFDMTAAGSYNPAFVTANGGTTASAMAALYSGFDDGKAYLNIHSTVFAGGEIRGFLEPDVKAVPEPGTMLLAGAALAGLICRRRRR